MVSKDKQDHSPLSRRNFFSASSAIGLSAGLSSQYALGQEEDARMKNAAELYAPARATVEKGLKSLVNQQQENGGFNVRGFETSAAIPGLVGMALISSGSTPNRGPYGKTVAKLVDYLVSITQVDGFIKDPQDQSHGPMYGHGFATLFLAECYGMSPNKKLRDKLEKAVRLLVDSQNDEGGWRYEPKKVPADLSVTVCEVMALRAARNAGIHVPKETIDLSTKYIKESQNADGGFRYMVREASQFPRSAAGVVALYMSSIYEGPEIERGLRYISKFQPGKNPNFRAGIFNNHFYYGHYYAVQAMWHAGGDYWNSWYPAIRDKLLKEAPDGVWSSSNGTVYATAMACIILQVPNNFLPILQR